MGKPDKKQPGAWVLGLFALPFAAVGLGMLLLSVLPTLYDWSRMQFWQPAEATLLAASLDRSRGSDSTSYTVKARYRYTVAGQVYEGERVAIGGGADNVGDFQQALGARLEQALRAGRPVQVWFDPSRPADAVIDRSLRAGLLAFKMVFVVVFGGVGIGLLVFAARGGQPFRQQPLRTTAAEGPPGKLEKIPGGVQMHFPAGRWWGLKLALGMVGLVFLAVGVLVPWESGAEIAPWVLRLAFGGVGGAVLVGAFYALTNSLHVRIDHAGLRTERRLLGQMLRWHEVPGTEIARMRVVESYTVETNHRRDVYYRIEAELRGGRKMTVAQDLRGRQEAERMLASIGRATGYPIR